MTQKNWWRLQLQSSENSGHFGTQVWSYAAGGLVEALGDAYLKHTA